MKNQQFNPVKYEFQDKDMRNIYGIDMASKNDYFAVVVNQLPPYDPRIPYVPRFKTVRQYTKTSYTDELEMLEQEMFARWPPYYIVPDYTNEKTFTDMLVKDYGKNKVEAINFSIPTKQMLKDDGLSIMRQGYQFPNPAQVKHVQLSAWIKMLVDQLLREQIITTPSNRISFSHPPGEHNDMATAWELSIHGCLRWALRPYAVPIIRSSSGRGKEKFNYRKPLDHMKELTKNPNVKIKSVSVSGG